MSTAFHGRSGYKIIHHGSCVIASDVGWQVPSVAVLHGEGDRCGLFLDHCRHSAVSGDAQPLPVPKLVRCNNGWEPSAGPQIFMVDLQDAWTYSSPAHQQPRSHPYVCHTPPPYICFSGICKTKHDWLCRSASERCHVHGSCHSSGLHSAESFAHSATHSLCSGSCTHGGLAVAVIFTHRHPPPCTGVRRAHRRQPTGAGRALRAGGLAVAVHCGGAAHHCPRPLHRPHAGAQPRAGRVPDARGAGVAVRA